ncbi:MAG: signal peptidase I [Candidatus Aenigmatarchaeota archaeon]
MVGHRKKEEKVERKEKSTFQKMTEGWFGYIFYAALGIIIAFLVNLSLAVALSTDLPVVAVVSSSMVHDRLTEANHYQWLEKKFGYNRSYIDSWPVANGFEIGDLPIIQGSKDYKVGDVVVFSVPCESSPIIHRIVYINEDGTFQTKGDHNPDQITKCCNLGTQVCYTEKNISKDQIHGKVIFIIPKLGYFKVAISEIFESLGRILGGT